MWQHHYVIHAMRMEELRAEADRHRRWHREDEENGRLAGRPSPGRAREATARALAAISRAAARFAHRLDERVALDLGADRRLRDA